MIHPTPPPLSGDNTIEDDDDIILLTEELSPAQPTELSDIFQLTDRSEHLEIPEKPEKPKDEPTFIDLTDAIEPTDFKVELPPDFTITEDDILNLDMGEKRFPEFIPAEPEPSLEAIAVPESLISPPDNILPLDSSEPEQPQAFLDVEDISQTAAATDFSDLQDIISEPIPSLPSVETDIITVPESEPEPHQDELQRLINEVVHDSQVPPADFSGVSAPIEIPEEVPLIPAVAPVVVHDAAPGVPVEPPTAITEPFSLPQEQIDAAVDRAIRSLFDEKIEPMMKEMLLTAVSQEIDHLKTVLLDSLASRKTI